MFGPLIGFNIHYNFYLYHFNSVCVYLPTDYRWKLASELNVADSISSPVARSLFFLVHHLR